MIKLREQETAVAEPAWDFARLFPTQGQWDEEDYFAIDTNQLVEFSNGHLEVLDMPSINHQLIILALFRLLDRFVEARQLGKVLLAPVKIQLWAGKYREPDLILILPPRYDQHTEQYWIGADLVMEVISPNDRQRDAKTKRREYAQAGISEYWIVDPEYQTITILTLPPTPGAPAYREHGKFSAGQQAISSLLPDFAVNVSQLFGGAKL